MSMSTLIIYVWLIAGIILTAWTFIEKIKDVLGFNSITLDEATKVACRLAEIKYIWCDRFAGEKSAMAEFSAEFSIEAGLLTTEDYLQKIEIYLDEACRQYAPSSSVSKQQAKEIAKLSVIIEFETDYRHRLDNRRTNDKSLPSPDIDISKLRELLPSCKDESLEEEVQELFKKTRNHMGLSDEQHEKLAQSICAISNNKLSHEDAYNLVSKNKMRILLKERRNASDEEILNIANAICIDYPTLSKKESKEILSLLL